MATKYYLRDAAQTGLSPDVTAKQSSDTDVGAVTGKTTPRQMNASAGVGQVDTSWTDTGNDTNRFAWYRTFLTPGLAAQTLLSGTVLSVGFADFVDLLTKVNSSSSRAFIWLWRPGTGYVSTLAGPTSRGVNMTDVSEKGRVWNVGTLGTNVALTAQDRIAVEAWAMANIITGRTKTFHEYYEGTTDPVDGVNITSAASYFNCSQTLSEYVAPSANRQWSCIMARAWDRLGEVFAPRRTIWRPDLLVPRRLLEGNLLGGVR
jgi:hypothetical protein